MSNDVVVSVAPDSRQNEKISKRTFKKEMSGEVLDKAEGNIQLFIFSCGMSGITSLLLPLSEDWRA